MSSWPAPSKPSYAGATPTTATPRSSRSNAANAPGSAANATNAGADHDHRPTPTRPTHPASALDGEARRRYLTAGAAVRERVLFAGRLEHEEVIDLLPACEALVVPSTFPEAYGMAAAEAASCGTLPISADHSGLTEVSRVVEAAVPDEVAPWLRFRLGDEAVPHLAACVVEWLQAPAALRERTRRALTAVARERFSWDGVARTVIAAAEGRLDDLPHLDSRLGAWQARRIVSGSQLQQIGHR